MPLVLVEKSHLVSRKPTSQICPIQSDQQLKQVPKDYQVIDSSWWYNRLRVLMRVLGIRKKLPICYWAAGCCMHCGPAMPNRNLNPDELRRANELLSDIRQKLVQLAGTDPLLLFAYRRKIVRSLDTMSAENQVFERNLKLLSGASKAGSVLTAPRSYL
jgi:hypothetical protein